jgi:hypothetical protein
MACQSKLGSQKACLSLSQFWSSPTGSGSPTFTTCKQESFCATKAVSRPQPPAPTTALLYGESEPRSAFKTVDRTGKSYSYPPSFGLRSIGVGHAYLRVVSFANGMLLAARRLTASRLLRLSRRARLWGQVDSRDPKQPLVTLLNIDCCDVAL